MAESLCIEPHLNFYFVFCVFTTVAFHLNLLTLIYKLVTLGGYETSTFAVLWIRIRIQELSGSGSTHVNIGEKIKAMIVKFKT